MRISKIKKFSDVFEMNMGFDLDIQRINSSNSCFFPRFLEKIEMYINGKIGSRDPK